MKKISFFLMLAIIITLFSSCAVKPAEEPGLERRVIIIGVDGAGAFFNQAETPNIDSIFENGATSYTVKTAYPSVSAECWGSLLTGLVPKYHGFTNGSTATEQNDSGNIPTIFSMVKEKYPDAVCAAFGNWGNINYGIIEPNLGIYKDKAKDDELTDKILEYLSENDPKLMFVQFDSVDAAGHGSGYGSEDHLAAITAIDVLIGKIYNAIAAKNDFYDTMFIVTADHGGIGGSHGGSTPEESNVFFGVIGKGVAHGEITDMVIRDIPAIVRSYLSLEDTATSEFFDSVIPEGVFENGTFEKRTIIDTTRKKTDAPGDMDQYIDVSSLRVYMPFENSADDVMNSITPVTEGKIYYPNGYYGVGAKLSKEGFINCGKVEFNTSFSIAAWVNIGSTSSYHNQPLYSNKNWKAPIGNGFTFWIGINPGFNVGTNNKEPLELYGYYPDDFFNTWIHTLIVVDRDNMKIKLYINFELADEADLEPRFTNTSFTGNLNFCIGKDGKGLFEDTPDAIIDEFMIFDCALDNESISKMNTYYNR